MKKLWAYIKASVKKHRSASTGITTLLVIVLIAVTFINALNSQASAMPSNPIQGLSEDSSLVKLTSTNEVVSTLPKGIPSATTSKVNADSSEEQKKEEKKNIKSSDKSPEKQNQPTGAGNQKGNQGANSGGSGNGNTNSGGSNGQKGNGNGNNNGDGTGGSGKENNNKELDKNGDKKNEYFKSSIIDGETVTNSNYSFTITQLNKELTVKNTFVNLNNDGDTDLTGYAKLSPGENQIKISVVYRDKDKKEFTVSKTYTVFLELLKIQINCDIKDSDIVTKSAYSFTAYAELSGKEIPVIVTLNGKTITSDSNKYKTELMEGKNHFSISASEGEVNEKKEYTITYDKPISDLSISTNLGDFEVVDIPEITFYAYGLRGGEKVGMKVICEGNELTDDGNGNYTMTFEKETTYHFVLTAYDDNGKYPKPYDVQYTFATGPGEDGEDPRLPVIITDLAEIESSGETVPELFTFYVAAKDYKGMYIQPSDIKVYLNGEEMTPVYPNINKISYNASVPDGTYSIKVWAYDTNHQKEQDRTFTITSSPKIVGTMHISMEATTVGASSIFDETVDIKQGENLAYVLERILGKYGIETEITGSLDEAYYLKAIKANYDLYETLQIPEDLMEKLVEWDAGTAQVLHLETCRGSNQLGEMDFTIGAGWMYSVNGEYPNIGFSDYVPKDGDDIRIRFTLAYGKDIGGGDAMGGNNPPPDGNQNGTDIGSVVWDKEW